MITDDLASLIKERRNSRALNCTVQAKQFLDDEENDEEGPVQVSRSKFSGPIPISFDLMTHAVSMSRDGNSLFCPECEVLLDLHQPDHNEPTQLLGVCASCNKWYFLVEIEFDWNGALLFELPSAGAIRAMLGTTANCG